MIRRPPRSTRTDTLFPTRRSSDLVSGLTFSTGDALGDETPYAAALCEALGIPLVGGHYAAAAVDIARPSLAHRPLPGGMAQLQSYDAVVLDTVASLGASAFMSGVGGDKIGRASCRERVCQYV